MSFKLFGGNKTSLEHWVYMILSHWLQLVVLPLLVPQEHLQMDLDPFKYYFNFVFLSSLRILTQVFSIRRKIQHFKHMKTCGLLLYTNMENVWVGYHNWSRDEIALLDIHVVISHDNILVPINMSNISY